MQQSEKTILRELGKQTAEIAALPQQRETVRQWKALNGLKPERPMFMIDQIPWHEMDVGGELKPICEDPFCRVIETELRRRLYKWRRMRDDMVVEPFIDIPKTITGAGFGISSQETTLAQDPENDVVSHHYEDLLETEEDLEKIRMPEVSLVAEATARDEAQAHDIFDGVLEVRMTGAGPLFFAPWDRIAQWRGVMNPLMDLADRPEFLHRTMERLTSAHLVLLDQLEAQGLLDASNNSVHCSGAWTDELPQEGFDAARPRAKDVWTCGMAQMLSSVSPAMHDEFEIEYAKRWYTRFGLVYYGCCEPLDRKIGIVRKLPHVRKISMSPWVDVDRGAEAIGGGYVFSRKPSPALLAVDSFDADAVEKDLVTTFDACRRHGCPVELILKDISTVRRGPARLWKWAEIARGLVERG
jgi:hypothetical protein